MVHFPYLKRIFFIPVLLLCLLIFLPSTTLSAWKDVSDSITLTRTRPLYNYVTQVTYCNCSLTNNSEESLQVPIRLVIDSITSSEVTINSPDGFMEDGKPYFNIGLLSGDFNGSGSIDGSDLSVFTALFGESDCNEGGPCDGDFDLDGDVDGTDIAALFSSFGQTLETLAPGKTSAARNIEFNNPDRLRFDFTVKVVVEGETEVIPESLTIDPASFSLASPGATQQLIVTGAFSDGSTSDLTSADTGTVYASNKLGVATVSPDGLVTAGTSNGAATITATNSGVSASTQVEVIIDVTLPVVTITAPKNGATLTSPLATVVGTIEDESPIESAFAKNTPLTLDGINFIAQVDLVEGVNPITVTATDSFGNMGSDSISVTYVIEAQDTTPPLVTITAPKDGAQLNQTPVTLMGTVQDASPLKSLTVNDETATLSDTLFSLNLGLAEGPNMITATATDEYDNIGSDSINVTLDTTPPTLTVEPVPYLTNKTEIPVRGASEPGAVIALTGGVSPVTGPTDQISGEFSLSAGLHQDTHNTLSVAASDNLGNTCRPKIFEIDQDSVPPQVVAVWPGTGATVSSRNVPCKVTFSEPVAPGTLILGASFQIICGGTEVNGALTLSQDNRVATFMPADTLPLGSQLDLLLTSAVTDLAGNQMTAPFTSHFLTPQEVGASVVTGEVYDDTKGLLLSGVTAKLVKSNGVPLLQNAPSMVTKADGLFTLEVSPGTQTILISRDGCTSVERKIEVASNVSAALLDARITPLDVKLNQVSGLAGGTAFNADEDIRVVFAEDSSSSNIEFRITKVSPQGLRSPLPLGWSPIITVDLAANIDQLRNPATVTIPVPSDLTDTGSLAAVRWDTESSAWRVLSQSVQAGDNGRIELSIIHLGQFSLVMADQGPTTPPAPETGDILEGAVVVAYQAGISGQGVLVPAVIMAGEDAHARASAGLSLPEALPSGTVFEAQVKETFTLRSSEEMISRPFVQDLHFYAWPDDGDTLTLSVEFPVTPSKEYALGELSLGRVDLYIREPQAAGTHMAGPAGGQITTDDGLDISIPPGCLDQNTTLRALSVPETLFYGPIPSGLTYLGGFNIDFGGMDLSSGIEVTLPPLSDAITLPSDPCIVMVRVENFADTPGLFLTGLGMVGDRVQSLSEQAGLTFSGIDRAGQYGFFLLADPIGFLHGTATAVSGQPSTNAVISHGALPFLARVDENGHYIQVGPVEEFEVIARNPVTFDQGTATATIAADRDIVDLDIAIQPTPPRVVSVTPAHGSIAISVSTSVSVTLSEPVSGVDADTFQLKDASGNTIAGHFSITEGGDVVTFYPDAGLASESAYTLYLGDDIKDKAGHSLAGFSPVTFTTEDLTPPVSQGELSISMPDENGLATITGSAGTAEPNSTIYIINNTSSMLVTISMPSSTDGSFSEQILADISDEIIVTIVDASGNEITLDPGPFVDETTGAVVVGPKGGTVKGEGGIALDIPAGALPYAAVIKVEPVDEPFVLPDDFEADPDLKQAFEENYECVTSVRIDTDGVEFNYGVDLSAPAPSGVSIGDTFIVVQDEEIELGGEHYNIDTDELVEHESNVVRRFKVADMATVKEIDGKLWIVTASPPFPGILPSLLLSSSTIRYFAPKTTIGVVVGTVIRRVTNSSGTVTGEYPVKGAVVRLFVSQVVPVYYAETNEDGLFIIPAITTLGLYDQIRLPLLVTDPLSGIIQQCNIPIGQSPKTYPEWNIINAAVLEYPFVLYSEKMIRKDKTSPTINITFSAPTLVDMVLEEGDDLTIDISVKDNRSQNPIIREIIINEVSTFVGVPNSYQHVIQDQDLPSGIYYIEVIAQDDSPDSDDASLKRILLVQKPGSIPWAVEGPPQLLSYDLDYVDDQQTVDINTSITITFNEPINTDTVDLTTFLFKDTTTGTSVEGRFVFTNYDSTVTFITSQSLKYRHSYEIRLNDIRDTEGLPVVVDPITFTTATPEVLGLYPMLFAKDLAVKGSYAFVTDVNLGDQTGLTVIDFSDPRVDFSTLSSYELSQKVKKISLQPDMYSSWAVGTSGNYAYVITVGKVSLDTLTLSCTLQKWDITDPLNPSKVLWIPLTSTTSLASVIPSRLVVSKGFVFVAMLGSGFKVIDANSLATVQNVQIVDYNQGVGQANDLAVLGEYAYVANVPPGHLSVVKFTDDQEGIDPEHPVIKIDSNPPGAAVNAYRIKVIENFRVKDGTGENKYLNLALVACLEQGLAIVDVTDPAHPEHLYTLNTPGRVIGLDVDKEAGLIVLSDSSGGLRVVDIHNMDLDHLSTTVCDLGGANSEDLGSPTKGGGIVFKDGLVYVTTAEGVRVVRLGPVDCAMEIYIEDGEHNLPVLPGGTATAKAITRPEGRPVVWSITESDPGVKADIDSSSGVITASDESDSGWIKIRATDVEEDACYKEARVYIGCSECDQSNAQYCQTLEGSGFVACSSIDFRLSVGKAKGGQSAGDLFLRAKQPSPDLGSPNALEFSTLVRNIKVRYDENGALCQVLAPKTFLDIVVANDFRYEARFYRPDDITGQEDGLYKISSSASPFVVWHIENPDASKDVYNRLRITESKDGANRTYEYTWDQEQNTWSLNKGNGLVIETRSTEWDEANNNRIVTHILKDGSSNIASQVRTTYHQFPWGEEPVEIVEDPEGSALTTVTTYYEDKDIAGSYERIRSRIHPDGSWVRYEYDEEGRKTVEIQSWLDAPVGTPAASARTIYYDYRPVDKNDAEAPRYTRIPRKVTEKIQGTILRKTYYAYLKNELREQTEIFERCVDPLMSYGNAGNQRTVTTYYPSGTDFADSGSVKSILYPDGRLDSFSYEYGTYASSKSPAESGFSSGLGKDLRETVVHGTVGHPTGIAYKTTRETSIRNEFGNELMREIYVFNGKDFERIQWTVQHFDEFGRLIKVMNSDGTQTENTWSCCAKESDTDTRGIRRTYVYDDLQRVETEVKDGISSGQWPSQTDIHTFYTYDAEGRRLSETVSAGELNLVTSNDYDLAGRLINTTDSAGLVTSYNYEQADRVIKVTRFGGITEITTRYLDGKIKSVTGTGVIPRYYEYDVNPEGTQWTKGYTGSMDSPRWEKSTMDMLGRTVRVEKPGFAGIETTENHYNVKGQRIKTTTAGQADTLYEYDESGIQVRYGLDVDHSGDLDENSNDRINENETFYALISQDWWEESLQRVYATESDGTATTTSVQRRRMTGWGNDGKTEERVSIDIHGNQVIEQVFANRDNKAETRVTDYPDSIIDEVSVHVNGLLMSSQGKTGVETTYSYDALGRRTGITDPRTGTTTTHYNNKGRVDYVGDPAGNRTRYSYDPGTGHRIKETNAFNNAIRYAYNDSGQVTHTWGNATYPVRYVYDSYGQKSRMYTYRNGANWDSETWPDSITGTADVTHWHYHEATGLLIDKEDAQGHCVSYTYIVGGKLATRTWSRTDGTNPLVTTYSYNPNTGELVGIDYSDSTPDIMFTYDRLGRQKTIADAVGTRIFSYNDELQLESETIIGLYNKVITPSYETNGVKGRPIGFTLGSDYNVTYGYGDAGRFSSVGWNVGGVSETATYSYVEDSDLLDQLATDNGQRTIYTYEPRRNLRTQVRNECGTQIISQYDYVYDAVGRRSSVANSGQAFAAVTNAFNLYDYNERNELTESARYLGLDISDTSNPVQPEHRGYTYDDIGNRKEAIDWHDVGNELRTMTYSANSLNQYSQINAENGEATTDNLAYDTDGNLILISDGIFSVDYTYNAENRLVAVVPQDPGVEDKKVEYTYDYMGRRVRKKVYTWESGAWADGSESLFVYDGWNMISEITTKNGQHTAKHYIWGLDLSQSLQGAGGIGGLIATIDGSSTYYFNYDGGGNVGQLMNVVDGTIAAKYEYGPYGNSIQSSGNYADNNHFRFSTKYHDETELYYYGYRYYMPEMGRWLTRDPIGEVSELNSYTAMLNNPGAHIDPVGLYKFEIKMPTIDTGRIPIPFTYFYWIRIKVDVQGTVNVEKSVSREKCPTKYPSNIRPTAKLQTYSQGIGVDASMGAEGDNFKGLIGYKIGFSTSGSNALERLFNLNLDVGVLYNDIEVELQKFIRNFRYKQYKTPCACVNAKLAIETDPEFGIYAGKALVVGGGALVLAAAANPVGQAALVAATPVGKTALVAASLVVIRDIFEQE